MSPEDSSDNKVTPLSQGLRRKPVPSENLEDKFVTTESLKEILSEYVSKPLVARLTRLETSFERMAKQFEAIRTGKAEDAALRVTTDRDAADLALAEISVSKEEYYPYTCILLADKLGVTPHVVQKVIKKLGLRGDAKYNIAISTGRKSEIQKWSEEALQKIEEALLKDEHTKIS